MKITPLVQRIKDERVNAAINKNESMKTACTMILGEIPRLNKKVDEIVHDDEIYKIINTLIKSELITLEYSGQSSSSYVDCLFSFLPEKVSKEKIIEFMKTIDFSSFKNINQCIPIIKKEFGENNVDINIIKEILNNKVEYGF